MRPLSLTVEGLRSFRSAVTIDFTGRDHVAIIGDTGAGKSSLLEAMTWALYGRTSWSGQPNQELMNDTSTSLRVVLCFRVAGQTWQVTRTLRRRGDRTVGPANAVLIRYDNRAEPIEQIEKVAPVRERVERLIGLDHEAFTRTVVLPQGQFAQLLVGDGDTRRADILRQVWRLDELEAAAAAAAHAREELVPLRARVEQALEAQPRDPTQHAAQLRAAAASLTEKEHAAQATRAAVEQACGQLRDARATVELVDVVVQELDFDATVHGERAAAVVAEARRLTAARQGLVSRRAACVTELNAVPGDGDGLTAVQVAAARSTVVTLPARVGRVTGAAEAARAAAQAADAARREATHRSACAEQARAAAQARLEARPQLVESCSHATDRLAAARRQLDSVRTQRVAVAGLTKKAGEQSEAAAQIAERLEGARTAAFDAERAAAAATATLADAQRDHAAAAAAHGVHAGDPCPVCDRDLPDGWQPPRAVALDDAQDATNRAAEKARSAADTVTVLTSRLAETRKYAAASSAEAEAGEVQAAQGTRRLAELLVGGDVDLRQSDDIVLRTVTAAATAAQQALDAHDADARVAQDEAARLGGLAARADATAEHQRHRADADRQAADDALSELRSAIASLPCELDVGIDLPEDVAELHHVSLPGVNAVLGVLDRREQVLSAREQRRAELREQIRVLDGELAKADAALERDVTTPADRLRASLEQHGKLLTRAAAKLDIVDIELPRLSGVAPSALGELVDELADRMQQVRQTATDRRRAAVASRDTAQAVLDAQAVALHLGTAAGPDAVSGAAAERHEEIRFAAQTARNTADAFAALVQPLHRLQRAATQLETASEAMSDLAAALKDGAFPKWVTLRRSRALLAHASRLLGEMTAGRYAFADLDDENDDWRIVDNDTGMPRSPASLSGGEKFVASLALAFGMVEMMARSGGRLESLWLDEGFGALDRSNLDAAVEALATVAAGGRLVAVISHIRAVAEQVHDVLAVTRTSTGSTARWLTNAERAQVAGTDDHDEDETLASLSGLLE